MEFSGGTPFAIYARLSTLPGLEMRGLAVHIGSQLQSLEPLETAFVKLGGLLRELRGAFLSKYLYQTYSGYVLSQFKKMKRAVEAGETFRPKHAMHLIRLLIQASKR